MNRYAKEKNVLRKLFITKAYYHELKQKADLYDELIKKNSNSKLPSDVLDEKEGQLEPKEKDSASEFEGHGVVANQVKPYQEESKEPHQENYTTQVAAQVPINLEFNKGLDNPLQSNVKVLANTNSDLALSTATTSKKEDHDGGSPSVSTKSSTSEDFDAFLKLVWLRNKEKASQLLHLLKNYPKQIHWTDNGDLFIKGHKMKSSLVELLPVLFPQKRKVPEDINILLKVLCELKLDSFISNNELIKDGKFNWWFLNY